MKKIIKFFKKYDWSVQLKVLSLLGLALVAGIVMAWCLENEPVNVPVDVAEVAEAKVYMDIPTVKAEAPQKIIEECPLSATFQNWLYKECESQGIDFYIVMSIMWHESRWQTDVVNETSGCIGLMQLDLNYWQLTDSNGNELDMSCECINAFEGIQALKKFLEEEGNLRDAIYRYSGGDSNYYDRVLAKSNEWR